MNTKKDIEISCFDCKNAKKYMGTCGSRYIQPDPPEAECQLKDEDINTLLESYEYNENVAKICPSFSPDETGVCAECKRVITSPKFVWSIWAYGYDNFPCCSEKCRISLQDKINEEMSELTITNKKIKENEHKTKNKGNIR